MRIYMLKKEYQEKTLFKKKYTFVIYFEKI